MQNRGTVALIGVALVAGAGGALITRFFAGPVAQSPGTAETRIQADAQGTALDRLGSFADAVSRSAPAVVSIFTTRAVAEVQPLPDARRPYPFGPPPPPVRREARETGLGSGVILSADGLILTNRHVIKEAERIRVILADGRRIQVAVLGVDAETDLAVLKADATDLPAAPIGDPKALRVGDLTLAIGNPYGMGQTVTQGIVSATGRAGLGITSIENFIQTDAAINPGNSGGALVDSTGNLMGINTAIYSRSGGSLGIGFAIPVSTARMVMEGLVKDGQVTRGWIGVEPNELSSELAETFGVKAERGVIITGVLQNGPAALAGVRPGDVISSVAGKDVANVSELLSAVAALKPGTPSQFRLQRREQQLDVDVTPGVRPKPRRQPQQ